MEQVNVEDIDGDGDADDERMGRKIRENKVIHCHSFRFLEIIFIFDSALCCNTKIQNLLPQIISFFHSIVILLFGDFHRKPKFIFITCGLIYRTLYRVDSIIENRPVFIHTSELRWLVKLDLIVFCPSKNSHFQVAFEFVHFHSTSSHLKSNHTNFVR